jgi:hypothetical protein
VKRYYEFPAVNIPVVFRLSAGEPNTSSRTLPRFLLTAPPRNLGLVSLQVLITNFKATS